MTIVEKVVTVEPTSDLAIALNDPNAERLVVRSGSKSWRLLVERASHTWPEYDPEAARKAIERNAGAWADLDADSMIADIYRWREEGSRDNFRDTKDEDDAE